MPEVLSKTADSEAPLQGQEFYELSLLDEANDLGTRYCVRQAHVEWSEIDGQVMWHLVVREHVEMKGIETTSAEKDGERWNDESELATAQ